MRVDERKRSMSVRSCGRDALAGAAVTIDDDNDNIDDDDDCGRMKGQTGKQPLE